MRDIPKIRKWMFALALLGPVLGNAQVTYNAGQNASWLDVPTSARYLAMGGADVAVADDLDALDGNPAGLGQLTGNSAAFSHNDWYGGTALENLRAAFNFGRGTLGLGGSYLELGSTDAYAIFGGVPVPQGVFQSSAWMGQVDYGFRTLPGLYLGAGIKIFGDRIGMAGDGGWGFDSGLLYRVPGLGLGFGLALRNVGNYDLAERMPRDMDMGLSFPVPLGQGSPLLLSAQFSTTLDEFGQGPFSLGAEYWAWNLLAFRLGQTFQDSQGLTGLDGLSAGIGVKWRSLELDFAMSFRGDLGTTDLVSLLVHF